MQRRRRIKNSFPLARNGTSCPCNQRPLIVTLVELAGRQTATIAGHAQDKRREEKELEAHKPAIAIRVSARRALQLLLLPQKPASLDFFLILCVTKFRIHG